MRNRNTPVGQYIIEGLGDTEGAETYIEDLMPLIGNVVIAFNSLESDIDHHICSYISDRSDQKGLIVLSNLMFSSKVDLFVKFTREYMLQADLDLPAFDTLVSDLRECGTLRNRVVHANWMYTDQDGYTQVRIKCTRNGLEHEHWQFSIESMQQVIQKIIETNERLDEFSIECEDQFLAKQSNCNE